LHEKKIACMSKCYHFTPQVFFLFKCLCWKIVDYIQRFFLFLRLDKKMVVLTINMTFEHKPIKKTMSWVYETNSSCIHQSFIYVIHPSIALFNKIKKWSLIGPSFGIGQGFKVEWGDLKCTRLVLVPSTNSWPSIKSLHFKKINRWVMLQNFWHLNHLRWGIILCWSFAPHVMKRQNLTNLFAPKNLHVKWLGDMKKLWHPCQMMCLQALRPSECVANYKTL